jgi:hypothetical protein
VRMRLPGARSTIAERQLLYTTSGKSTRGK